MRTYPSSAVVQPATYYYYPGRWIQYFKAALTVHNFHSQGTIPCRATYGGVTGKYIHNIILHILPGTHLYTWVESSNVDKLSCWRTKVPGIDGKMKMKIKDSGCGVLMY